MPAFLQNLYMKANHRYQRLTFKPYTIHRDISGTPFDFYIADPVAREWYDTGSSEWKEMDYFKKHLIKPGDVIIECGAHHGFTTSYFSKAVGPKGKVIAFEPSPFNVEVIKKNLALNHIKNTKVVNKAIGEKKGTSHFSFVSNGSIQSSAVGTFPIEVTPIDAYIKEKPTVLKIDVEGYDVEALKGAREVLKTLPKMEIEIHTEQLPAFGHTVQDVFDLIDLSKYNCTIMSHGKFTPLGSIKDIKTNVHLFAVPK